VSANWDFAGCRVLITGGGSGVGADMAQRFARAGAMVHIAGRRKAPLQTVADSHAGISWHVADVTDEQEVEGLFEAAGPLDIVIANAGQANSNPLTRLSKAQWDEMLSVNLTGVFLSFREAARRFDGAWGRMIAISSRIT